MMKVYQENTYILYQLSKCIEISTDDDVLSRLYELKHFIINENQKIDDYYMNLFMERG